MDNRNRNDQSTCESEQARARLMRYAVETEHAPEDPSPLLRRFAKRVLPTALHYPVRSAATDALRLRERHHANNLARKGDIRLHLGSGRRRKPGWVNIDLFLGAPVDLGWKLPRPLPFAPQTVNAIFHEHLLEHLTLEQGLALLDECHRLLRLGGILRIGVPDAGVYLRAYAGDDRRILDEVRPGRPTRLLAIQEVFYRHGHRTMYDLETLTLLCKAAGFSRVEERSFGDSRLDPAPDSEGRRSETLYVEAVR
jgi:predicted SAM-dependent methyltransferase